jgi:hypothetical protein
MSWQDVGRASQDRFHGSRSAPTSVDGIFGRYNAKRVRAGLEDPHTVIGRGFDEPDHMADTVGLR